MIMRRTKWGVTVFLMIVVVFILACSVSTAPNTTSPPAFDPTKAVLELQATSMALQLTQAALNAQPPVQQPTLPQPTLPPPPTAEQPVATPQVQQTPTEDMEARIRAANVLVYENPDEYGIGMWVQDALDGMGIKYTQTGSYSGRFMEYLNSGKP